MSYAIGHIVYGIDLTQSYGLDEWEEYRDAISDLRDADALQGAYSGSGDSPLWLGVTLGEIDECNNVTFADVQRMAEVTDKALADYKALLDETLTWTDLPDGFLEKLRTTEPQVWILWGSS